jgi:(p)ppGpp synthase/HD superfamily hydrolase
MMDLIKQARDFARAAHAGQFRQGADREPYETHVAEVAGLVARFGGTIPVIAAGWLHDTVEDCAVTPDEIATQFGAAVAGLVAELTDDKTLPKAMRKALQVQHAPGKSPEAALLKICDKIANVRSVGDSPALGWGRDRELAYLDWASAVVIRLPSGANPARALFAQTVMASRAAVLGR